MVTAKELNKFLGRFQEEIREAARVMESQKLPELTDDLFALYEQTGNRLTYEKAYFGRRKFLAVFGLLSLLEKQQTDTVPVRVINKLETVMTEVCREECWALPAHVNRADNPNWRMTVDLFAAETAQTLAELTDRLDGILPEGLRILVCENIEHRVFRPYFSSTVPYGIWEHAHHNWNAVCGGSIGSACLHVMRSQPGRLKECLERISNALPYYVSGFAEDGTCMEGLSYFTYGMTYFVNFAEELFEYTGGRTDLLTGSWAGFFAGKEDKRYRMAVFQEKCYFEDGCSISFSDGYRNEKYRVGLSAVLAMRFPGVHLPRIENAAGLQDDTCYRFAALKMDLLMTEKYCRQLEKQEPAPAGYGRREPVILPDAQWCIGNSANGVGFACKGGSNGEPHNHNDIGHFIYESNGVFLLTDLGAGEYTRDYFGEKRYDILCNNSFGHSVPIINHTGQVPGCDSSCANFQAGKDGHISMELSGAYNGSGAGSLIRSFHFNMEQGELTTIDRLSGKEDDFRENLVTQIKPVIQGNQVWLEDNGICGILTVEEGLEGPITVQTHNHINHSGSTEKVYTISWKVASIEEICVSRFGIKVT